MFNLSKHFKVSYHITQQIGCRPFNNIPSLFQNKFIVYNFFVPAWSAQMKVFLLNENIRCVPNDHIIVHGNVYSFEPPTISYTGTHFYVQLTFCNFSQCSHKREEEENKSNHTKDCPFSFIYNPISVLCAINQERKN